MVRILIADDHAIVREGLKRIIAEVPDLVVAAEAGDGEEALEIVRRQSIDLVILDLSMPSPFPKLLTRHRNSVTLNGNGRRSQCSSLVCIPANNMLGG
ncbi:MAG: hypothetical protein C4294_13745 [Nitrospiraceae bacterium]